ncbi:unnamed protein product [Fusarium graminearum]|uniref:Uncharacterized protein n=1 Tax=Gibberella zeae TaxID=5518 RepID=A0A9N8WSB2_GIBZA|nr:unnamed protein product [Fusarium graminearum]
MAAVYSFSCHHQFRVYYRTNCYKFVFFSILPAFATTPSFHQNSERLVTNTSPAALSTTSPTKTAVETAAGTMADTMTVTVTVTAAPGGGDTGLPTTSIVGIALGSAAAAVALTLCAIALLYLKRRRLHPTDPDVSSDTSPEIFVPETSTRELGPDNGFTGLPTCLLLDGRSCSEIEFELGAITWCHFQSHVRTFYHLDNVSVTPSTLHASLRKLHLTDATCHMIARLAIDPKTRYLTIRHLLARVIFSNLDTHNITSLSLLPPTVKELFLSRATFRVDGRPPRFETAVRSWHRITALLLHENPPSREFFKPPPSVKSQIDELATVLQESLVHFVRKDNDDQHDHLTFIIERSVKLGYEVYAHPNEWEFIFPEDEEALFVTPGLNLITDDRGVPHDPPFVALDPEIVAIKDARN